MSICQFGAALFGGYRRGRYFNFVNSCEVCIQFSDQSLVPATQLTCGFAQSLPLLVQSTAPAVDSRFGERNKPRQSRWISLLKEPLDIVLPTDISLESPSHFARARVSAQNGCETGRTAVRNRHIGRVGRRTIGRSPARQSPSYANVVRGSCRSPGIRAISAR